MNENYRMSVKEAANILGKSEMFVRIGLREKILPFGYAIKIGTKKYSYHISPMLFKKYIGDYQKGIEKENN